MNQPAQQQQPPGRTAELSPHPDHGEESYRGSGRLAGKAAVITGGDSGIGRAVAIAYAREGIRRGELHLRRADRRHRRQAHPVSIPPVRAVDVEMRSWRTCGSHVHG